MQSDIARVQTLLSDSNSRSSIFPLPPLTHPQHPRSSSRRVVARYHRLLSNINKTNQSILALNSLYSSFSVINSKTSSSSSILSSFIPSSVQFRLQSRLLSLCSNFNNSRRSSGSGSGECGINDFSLSSMYDLLLSRQVGSSYSLNDYIQQSQAVPLIADRVSLPVRAGEVDLLSMLPDTIASVYRQPSTCIKQGPILPPSIRGGVRVYASHHEYVKLLLRMSGVGMISVTSEPIVVNGLFGTPKGDGTIRLIVDGRPANEVFCDPPHIELPTPDLLSRLSVDSSKPVFVAKSDLADYYYRFRIPTWMQRYFALPPVLASELGMDGDGLVYPCLTVLAMGWSHSVYLGQSAHEHLLNRVSGLSSFDRITLSSDLLINRVRHMVYIDDVIILGIDRVAVSNTQSNYLTIAEENGLPAKSTKVVEATSSGVECLGIELNGNQRTIGARADKLQLLCNETFSLINGGVCTGIQLARLVGKWTWCMLVMRPALSIFTAVYRFIKYAGTAYFTIWPSVVRELVMVTYLAPLLTVSLDSNWLPFVLATDASELAQGVVKADVSPDLIITASSSTGKQSLTHHQHGDDQAIIDATIIKRPWQVLVSSAWKRNINPSTGVTSERIESLEMRAASTAIRHVLSRPISINARLLLLCDSQVVVGALAKGRSSSHVLLRRLRPICAMMLASGLRVYSRWIPGAVNPADSPSRLYY